MHHAPGPPENTCILTGAKSIENRPRDWSWRGWMLLHARQRIDRPALRVPLIARTIRGRELTTGAVIGIARLIDCHQDPEGSAGRSGYLKLRNECHPVARCARRVHALGIGNRR
ncbi:hypothetical protein ABT232_37555 [Streptomyces sp. NPDC001532]|uniref:hypothetical protein n=1 Tax=Streptomyces sp. NPDC001532 TaxID=3154520 RepID=UPI0033188A95